ncbi:MAG: SGNH/GDSL hydrolase family protein [Deltaproteobacteria bacterium]|nr:SGNH/GDSL hydrolase family protein [Deltaproteobacteria bacterium]
MTNPSGSFFDRKTIIFIILLGLLSFFFNIALFIIFIVVIFLLCFFVCKYPGRYNVGFKRCLENLIILSLSFFLMILAFESYLRIGQPQFLKLENSILGEFSDYQKRGYLDEKVFHKPDGTFRILGLGDSFARNLTWTHQNYHDYLQDWFLKVGQSNVEVINAGMEGTGPGYFWHILRKYGPRLRPDLVIVGFFMDDFSRMDFNVTFRGSYGLKDCVEPLQEFFYLCQFKNWWLYQLSYRNYIIWWDRKEKAKEEVNKPIEKEATFSEKRFMEIERDRSWIIQEKNKHRFIELINKKANVILKIRDWCNDRNVRLLIAIFPDQFQVDDKLLNKIRVTYKLESESLDINFPNKLLSDFCRQNDIEFIDMVPSFQKVAASKELYRINDTHWSAEGNLLAAEILFNRIQEEQLTKTSQIN